MSQLVSIRMPKKMLVDLKKTAKNSYSMDLSDHMRSIIRKKSMEYAFPYKSEIAKISAKVNKEAEYSRTKAKKEILKEIQKFLEVEE